MLINESSYGSDVRECGGWRLEVAWRLMRVAIIQYYSMLLYDRLLNVSWLTVSEQESRVSEATLSMMQSEERLPLKSYKGV